MRLEQQEAQAKALQESGGKANKNSMAMLGLGNATTTSSQNEIYNSTSEFGKTMAPFKSSQQDEFDVPRRSLF